MKFSIALFVHTVFIRTLARGSMHQPSDQILLNMIKGLPPPLTKTAHKGEAGRIGIIGGCQEYTGAPYFAAISALKTGGDLSHVFCTRDAAPVIKSYSPELIVHPLLDVPDSLGQISQWLPRLHSLVIGPGLGREPEVFKTVKGIIEEAKKLKMKLVIDADGLFFVNQNPAVIQNYKQTILTPNAVEFSRLYEVLLGSLLDKSHSAEQSVVEVARKLGNLTVVRKGEEDIISDGQRVLVCREEGMPRRCGGQGDVLSGVMGLFTHWSHLAVDRNPGDPVLTEYGPMMSAAYTASRFTRKCANGAFEKLGRSTTTTDLLAELRTVSIDMFP